MLESVVLAIETVIDRVSGYELAHQTNIAAHVFFGLGGLLLGFAQFFTKKGSMAHRWIGRLFLGCFSVVIVSAILGSILFEFRAFLVVITLLAAYSAISGYRVLKIRRDGLSGFDVGFSLLGLAAVGGFVFAIERGNYMWDRTVIYSTLGALAVIAGYDLLRLVFPRRVLETTWIYEHIYKMTSAFSALSSAALGTVLPKWQTASQLGPSVVGVLVILFFGLRAARYKAA